MLDRIINGFLVLVALVCVGCASTITPPDKDEKLTGNWYGVIEVPDNAIYINIDLQKATDKWSGRISIPQQGLTGFPLTHISINEDNLTFAIPGIPGEPTFTGRLENGRITGTYKQGDRSDGFFLQREQMAIPGMLSPEQAATIIDNQLAAFNSHDLDQFLAFFHPDIEVYNYPDKFDKRGLESLRATFTESFKAKPDEKVITRIIAHNNVIDYVEVTFEFMGYRITDHSTVIYTIEDGLIRRMTFFK